MGRHVEGALFNTTNAVSLVRGHVSRTAASVNSISAPDGAMAVPARTLTANVRTGAVVCQLHVQSLDDPVTVDQSYEAVQLAQRLLLLREVACVQHPAAEEPHIAQRAGRIECSAELERATAATAARRSFVAGMLFARYRSNSPRKAKSCTT